MGNIIKGTFFILSAGFLWGFIGIFASFAFNEGVSPIEVAFWRAVFTGGFFGVYALIKKEINFDKKDLPFLFLFGFIGVTIFYISYQYAVKTGGVALASVLLYTAPAWVVLFSRIIFKEKFTPLKIISLLLTIGGVFLVSTNSESFGEKVSFIAIVSGLIAGLSYSIYFILGKHFSSRYSAANLFLYVCPIGMVGIFPFVNFVPKSSVAWASIIAIAFLSTFIANYFYYASLKFLPAGKASIMATIEPVVAAVAAYIIFGEFFGFTALIGSLAIIFAVILSITDNSN